MRIDGATPTGIRQKLVDEFQNDEGTRVAVLSIKAAGMGLTLTAASLVVFGELSWTPGDIVQAEDRAHRIGQVNSVDVKFLCAKNTVDDVMWGSVQNKLENLGQVLDGTSGDCLELAKSAQAPPRTREQRLASLAAFGDRSPGGGPRRDEFAALAGEPPKRQATLDGFVARRDSGTGTGTGDRRSRGNGDERSRGKGTVGVVSAARVGRRRRLHGLAALQRRGETTAARLKESPLGLFFETRDAVVVGYAPRARAGVFRAGVGIVYSFFDSHPRATRV